MTSKNNLSAFKRPAAKSVLQAATAQTTTPSKPQKRASDRVTKRAQVMFTEEEFAQLNAKRGGIPLSAYLRSKLKEMGEI